jgi:Ca-activated chloride channel family protein
VPSVIAPDASLTSAWARAHLRDLEDQYVSSDGVELEDRITATSLRFGVLCRFTAWLAVDTRIATDGSPVHRVIQPVEPVADSLLDHEYSRGITFAPVSASMPMPAPTMAMNRSLMAGAPAALARQAAGGRSGKARPRKETAAVVDLSPIVGQATEEAARLRAAHDAPQHERRELLADLGSRLAALVRHYGGEASLDPVRELVGQLDADRPLLLPGDEFEQLWTRTLAVLDDLAGSPAKGSRAFWKKGTVKP